MHYCRPYNAIPTNLLRVGSVCGLGLDTLGIHTLSLAAGQRTASNSGTLADGLGKLKQFVNLIVPPFMLSAQMEGEIIEPFNGT